MNYDSEFDVGDVADALYQHLLNLTKCSSTSSGTFQVHRVQA